MQSYHFDLNFRYNAYEDFVNTNDNHRNYLALIILSSWILICFYKLQEQ